MNSKIGIVIEREYKTRVCKWSFLLFTLFAPILFTLISILPALLMGSSKDEQRVAVVDRTGLYGHLFASGEQYEFTALDLTMADIRQTLSSDTAEYTAFLEIRQDLRQDPKAMTLYSHKTLPSGLEDHINRTLSQYLSDQALEAHNIPNIKEIIRESKVSVKVPTYRLDKDGAEVMTSGSFASVIGVIMAISIYMFISIYGAMVMQGVMEEKKSRIMEVMVSSIKPFELMMGKLIGIGLVGLTQIFIWIVLTTGLFFGAQLLLLGQFYDAEAISALQASGQYAGTDTETFAQAFGALSGVNFFELGVLFVFYFIGGYLLYSSIYAALASAVSSEEDSAQIMMPVTLLMMVGFYLGFACVQNPESTLALWCSYIPFTSPMVMLVRIPYGVSLWEVILSIGVLYGSFVALTLLAGKVYRVGILMYGKKPTFAEIWRWVRYH